MEQIEYRGELLAIIVPSEYHAEGIKFFTPAEFSQQLAYMNRPTGYLIEPHIHKRVERTVHSTLETLLIRKGKVKVDFYTNEEAFVQSKVLKTGDVLLLVSGGHGFTMLEPTEMIEVKQGPYAGEMDKQRFKGTLNG